MSGFTSLVKEDDQITQIITARNASSTVCTLYKMQEVNRIWVHLPKFTVLKGPKSDFLNGTCTWKLGRQRYNFVTYIPQKDELDYNNLILS